SIAVAQVQEDHAAVVAPAVDPALQETRLSGVGQAQLTAGVGAAHRWASWHGGRRATLATRGSRRPNYSDCTGAHRRRRTCKGRRDVPGTWGVAGEAVGRRAAAG